jgi:hypothetical protein
MHHFKFNMAWHISGSKNVRFKLCWRIHSIMLFGIFTFSHHLPQPMHARMQTTHEHASHFASAPGDYSNAFSEQQNMMLRRARHRLVDNAMRLPDAAVNDYLGAAAAPTGLV